MEVFFYGYHSITKTAYQAGKALYVICNTSYTPFLTSKTFLPSLKLFEPADEHDPCLRFQFGDMKIMRHLGSDNNAEGGGGASNIHQTKKDSDRGKMCSISQFCKSPSTTSARWDEYSHFIGVLLCSMYCQLSF